MRVRIKMVILGYVVAFTCFLLFYKLQVNEYGKTYSINISNISDRTDDFEYMVDLPVDSDYIVLSGYAYQTQVEYKKIDYKIILLNQKTGKAFCVKTQPIERKDLVEKNSNLSFSKVGLYGRVSKGAGAFSENYYEICYLIKINDEDECIVHTGFFMGTPEEER